MARWLSVALLISVQGCAFSLDGPDPNRPRNQIPKCDTSKGLVALDGVMAAGMGVASLSIVSDSDAAAAALIPLAVGALYVAGAYSGNKSVNACRAAMAEYSDGYGREHFAAQLDAQDERPRRSRVSRDEDTRTGRNATRPVPPTYQYRPPGAPAYQPAGVPVGPYQTPPPPQQQQPLPQPEPAPQAPVQPPPPQPQPRPQPPRKQPPPPSADGDWTDFWREVP